MSKIASSSQPNRKSLPTVLAFSLVFFPLAFVGLIVHELGHGLTAEALGGQLVGLWVFPGVELWPDFGAAYDGNFAYFGLARYLTGLHWTDTERGWTTLMGSGSTFIVSVLALSALLTLKPRNRWRRYVLVSLALWYLDLLTYTVLPQLNLRHWIILGGRSAEPVIGAGRLGIGRAPFTIVVVVGCTVMSVMVDTTGNQGISFVRRGVVIEENQPSGQ